MAVDVLQAAGEPLLVHEYRGEQSVDDEGNRLAGLRFRVHLEELASGEDNVQLYLDLIDRITQDRMSVEARPDLMRKFPFWVHEFDDVYRLVAREEIVEQSLPSRLRSGIIKRDEEASRQFSDPSSKMPELPDRPVPIVAILPKRGVRRIDRAEAIARGKDLISFAQGVLGDAKSAEVLLRDGSKINIRRNIYAEKFPFPGLTPISINKGELLIWALASIGESWTFTNEGVFHWDHLHDRRLVEVSVMREVGPEELDVLLTELKSGSVKLEQKGA